MTQPTKFLRKGFSMLEMAIVLVIMGVATYALINMTAVQQLKGEIEETRMKMKRIDDALTAYYQTYGYLPCPSLGTLAITHADFGKDTITHTGKNDSSVTNTNCTASSNLVSIESPPRVYLGVVPTRTLGLPDSYMFDAWDNRISYLVSRHCVAPDNWQIKSSTYTYKYKCNETGSKANDILTSGGKIKINSDYTPDSNSWWPTTDLPFAAYLTMSHGKNGMGGWNTNGTLNMKVYQAYDGAGWIDYGTNTALTNAPTAIPLSRFLVEYFDNSTYGDTAKYFDNLISYRTAPQIYYDAK